MMVALDEVRRTFGPVVAVQGLRLRVAAGSVTVLLGPNGAGKTTVVRLVTGALAPHGGQVRVLGLDPTGKDGTAVRRRCGVVPARPALYDRAGGVPRSPAGDQRGADVSSAVAANTVIGERERGSGEFLAHSPARSTWASSSPAWCRGTSRRRSASAATRSS